MPSSAVAPLGAPPGRAALSTLPPLVDPDGRDGSGLIAAIHPALASVPLAGEAWEREQGRLQAIEADLTETQALLDSARVELAGLQADETHLAGVVARATQRYTTATSMVLAVRRDRRELAAAAFVNGASVDVEAMSLEPEDLLRFEQTDQLLDSSSQAQFERDLHLTTTILESAREVAGRTERLAVTRAAITEAQAVIATSEVSLVDLAAARETQAQVVEQTRATSEVQGAGFTLVVLDAYYRAALTMGRTDPTCGIRWEAIAGIARVESRHGTYRGSTVEADGDTTRHIIGVPLDGEGPVALILDTDDGRLDGDTIYDRAVGPTQFIPTTWRRYASDQTGDGFADPHNMYDAALTTARFLCVSRPLTSDAALRAAYLRYNRSTEYVEAVLGHTHRYDAMGLPPN